MDKDERASSSVGEQADASQSSSNPPQDQFSDEDMASLLEDTRQKADENWNQLLRAKADLENLRRRGERELQNAHRYALEGFAAELLLVKDSMELGLAASETVNAQKLHEGMELTHKMLQTTLEKFGISEVNALNQKFNPELHQAIAIQGRADVEPNTVLTVTQKGYLLRDRLLRPAMVIVSKSPQADL